LILTLTFRWFI